MPVFAMAAPGLAGSAEGVGVYAQGVGYDVFGDYGIILKKV